MDYLETCTVFNGACETTECCDDGFVRRDGDFSRVSQGSPSRPLCGCARDDDDGVSDQPSDRGGVATQVAVFWALVVVFLFLCHRSTRCRPKRAAAKSNDEREFVSKVNKSKAALVKTRGEGQCCICLSPLDTNVVRPPGCQHCYHKACLEEWIDQAKNRAVLDRDPQTRDHLAKRMLSCPICSRPILARPTRLEEEESKHRDFVELIQISTEEEDPEDPRLDDPVLLLTAPSDRADSDDPGDPDDDLPDGICPHVAL
ncbi:hypothetical protein CTAYLR_007480 [Chrysophaeum taylorii]|uniref:RING-type domain-containing protein n=1 Tax=Chrysophaeum taylorii TaxID=2483200 RepID=A0AAD7UD78_9STRA|nr:hypothetical protein CTAYLR_007480 [Chrysophaeum taylorii]